MITHDYESIPTRLRKHDPHSAIVADVIEAAIKLLHLVDKIDVNTVESTDVNQPVTDIDVIEARELLRGELENMENNL